MQGLRHDLPLKEGVPGSQQQGPWRKELRDPHSREEVARFSDEKMHLPAPISLASSGRRADRDPVWWSLHHLESSLGIPGKLSYRFELCHKIVVPILRREDHGRVDLMPSSLGEIHGAFPTPNWIII